MRVLMPAFRSFFAPSWLGSRLPQMTFSMPFFMMRSVQGGVFP